MDLVPAEGRRPRFIDDFTRTVVAAAELDNFAPLAQLVDESCATAEIHADPKLLADSGAPSPGPATSHPQPLG